MLTAKTSQDPATPTSVTTNSTSQIDKDQKDKEERLKAVARRSDENIIVEDESGWGFEIFVLYMAFLVFCFVAR